MKSRALRRHCLLLEAPFSLGSSRYCFTSWMVSGHSVLAAYDPVQCLVRVRWKTRVKCRVQYMHATRNTLQPREFEILLGTVLEIATTGRAWGICCFDNTLKSVGKIFLLIHLRDDPSTAGILHRLCARWATTTKDILPIAIMR